MTHLPLRKGFVSLVSVVVLGLTAAAAVGARHGGVTLVSAGKPAAVVVVPDGAGQGAPEQVAASLLVTHLRQMSGVTLSIKRQQELGAARIVGGRFVLPVPVVDQGLPDEALLGTEGVPGEDAALSVPSLNAVFIGPGELVRRLGVDTEGLGVGGIRLKTTANAVVLLGGPASVPEESGTDAGGLEYAVLELLEQLGCRYLWPTPAGKVVPRQATVVVAPLDIRYTPRIRRRYMRWARWSGRSDTGARQLGLTREQIERWQHESRQRSGEAQAPGTGAAADISWVRWQRLGGRLPGFGHVGGGLGADGVRYMEDHPEWFALQADGTRDQGGDARFRICHANLELIGYVASGIVRRVNAAPTISLAGIDENDGGSNTGMCLCPACEALDPADAPRVPLMTFGARLDPAKPLRRRSIIEHAALADRMVWYWNAVAERVAQEHPQVAVGVSVASLWTQPPVRRKLHPNILARYADSSARLFQGWQEAGLRQLYWRPNVLLFNRRDAKLKSLVGSLAESFSIFADAGVRQTDFDSVYHMWSTGGLTYYAAARLHWNPHAQMAEIIDDYARRGFGRGAGFIRTYWLRIEELTPRVQRAQAAPDDYVYTPAVVAELRALLDAAAAAEPGDPTIAERVAFLRLGLNLTELHETLDDLARRAGAEDTTADADLARRLLDLNCLVLVDMLIDQPMAVNVVGLTYNSGGFAKWRVLAPGRSPARLSDDKLMERVHDPKYGLTGRENSITDMFRAFGLDG